jgi:CRP-like cAMP-binding protein
MRSGTEMIAWSATLMVALAVGLNEAIATGILVSLVNYLWRASKPNLRISEHYSRDGRLVSTVTLDGNLFFGAVQYVERALADVDHAGEPGIFLIRTDHLTYLDVPGAQLIAEEAKRRQGNGDDVYVYLSREDILDALDRAGALSALGDDGVIHRDRDHPAKELLNPYRPSVASRPSVSTGTDLGELAAELRKIRMFSPFPTAGLQTLLEQAGLREATAGERILSRQETADNHVLLLEGAVEVERNWATMDGVQKNSIRLVEASGSEPVVITASPRGLQLCAIGEVRFVVLDAAAVDEIAGRGAASVSDNIQEGLSRSGIMRELAPEQLQRVLEAMVPVEIEAGEPVVQQGEPGEEYFLIEEGDAEVWREDAFTGHSSKLAVLGPGDTFGEEALLQGGYRNATVRMATPGRLRKLSKTDFDRLLKEPMAREIGAEEARQMIESGSAILLDCRYDLEIRESRIPGARALPLDQIRNLSHRLEPGPSYLVYCRNGQRSRVAAFLLKERGLEAVSVTGGIADWPYDIDLGPIEDVDKLMV